MKALSPSFKGILFIFIVLASVCRHAIADDTPTTLPMVQGIVASATNLAFNAEPTKRTNATTVTVHLIGAEGWYDAVHLAEDVMFSSNTQSHWRPPLGNYDGGTTITFILSSGDALKTIWAVLDGGGESISTPPTSATLILDTTQPDVTSSTLQTQPNLRLHVTMEFSEPVHEFTADDIWLSGVAISAENFTGEGTEYSFDVVASGEGELTIGFYTDDVFDLAGNPVIEQASPLVEHHPFTPLETPEATESAVLTGGLFFPSPLSLEESGGGQSMMLMGTMDPVWVDFNWSEGGDGSQANPYDTLALGLANVSDQGAIHIKPGTSGETPRITQAVTLTAEGGPARIGDLSENQTLFVQFDFGIPVEAVEDTVVAQVIRGSTADAQAFEIELVETVVDGQRTTIPSSSFELVPMTEGNYNLVWKAPAGVDLSQIDSFDITINEVLSGGGSVFAEKLSLVVDSNSLDRVLQLIILTGPNAVWRMELPPYELTADPGNTTNKFFVFNTGEAYTGTITMLADLSGEDEPQHQAWWAGPSYPPTFSDWHLSFDLTQGSFTNSPQLWIHDPLHLLSPGPGTGEGSYVAVFVGLKFDPISTQNTFYVAETTQTHPDDDLPSNASLELAGLNVLLDEGFDTNIAELVAEQLPPDDPQASEGAIALLDATNPASPSTLLGAAQSEAVIPYASLGEDETLPLIVQGAEIGAKKFVVKLRPTISPGDDYNPLREKDVSIFGLDGNVYRGDAETVIAENEEETPGGFIAANIDDDDVDEVKDSEDTDGIDGGAGMQENDLIKYHASFENIDDQDVGKIVLHRSHDQIKLWTDRLKPNAQTELVFDQNNQKDRVYVLPTDYAIFAAEIADKDLWIEATDVSQTVGDTVLSLSYYDTNDVELYTDKSNITAFTIQLFEGIETIDLDPLRTNYDKYRLISGTPQMPGLHARLWPNDMPGTADWTLLIEYDRFSRGDQEMYEETSLPVSSFWDIVGEFGDQFRGGRATLTVQTNDITQQALFHIRGDNPDDSADEAFISANAGVHWYADAIVRHESFQDPFRYNQFNNSFGGSTYGPDWDDIFKAPNFGGPDGWGMMQIDRSAEESTATEQELWSWKQNVLSGIAELTQKRSDANEYFLAVERTFPQQYEDPPSLEISATTLAPLDAATIQLYNSGAVAANLLIPGGDLENPNDYTIYRSCWRFTPSANTGERWTFVENTQNYVHEVVAHYEQ